MDGSTLRDYATEAIRYWEPRRLFYNLFLVLVVANVAYCAAYLVDLFVQASAFRSHWRQFRWLLFGLGSAFAAVLTRYVSMTLFAAVAAGAK